jgi:hypothetical protein
VQYLFMAEGEVKLAEKRGDLVPNRSGPSTTAQNLG